MKYIDTHSCRLEMGRLDESSLNTLLRENYGDSKKVIIVDENTHKYCLEYLLTTFDSLSEAEIILIPAGEDHKQLEIANSIWEALTEYGLSRHDIILNLGGGVITDMGGFIASCYKRGCDFINIPTTLLGMVDASIGGKTGVNLGPYKNQIGLFSDPVGIFIDISFLETLPEQEYFGGYAEMLKHGLISSSELFHELITQLNAKNKITEELLIRVIEVKNELVKKDPTEKGLRKILNFGHTIGHVLEGHFMTSESMTHGHFVAIGIVMESYLSYKMNLLDGDSFELIQGEILKHYSIPMYSNIEVNEMAEMLGNDKKNKGGKILCCLLDSIGNCVIDREISQEQFIDVMLHYKNLRINPN